MLNQDAFVYVLAFGGHGAERPGAANYAIAKEAASRGPGEVIFTEPEIAELLKRDFDDASFETYVVPDGPRRRRFLVRSEVREFAEWFRQCDSDRTAIITVGDLSTGDGSPQEYKGSGWVAAQIAQLAKSVGLNHAELIGQTNHLEDYARALVTEEFELRQIDVVSDSSIGETKEDLRVWDPSSSQAWVRDLSAWNERLPAAKLAIEADRVERRTEVALTRGG